MSEKASSRWAIFTRGWLSVVAGYFCSEISTQISEHFLVYLRLHGADHSDLGIIGEKHATSTSVSGVLITYFSLVGSTVRHGILESSFLFDISYYRPVH